MQSHKNFSFRPRKPIVNPVELQRQEYEKQIQMRNEAKERSQLYSLKNKEKVTMNTVSVIYWLNYIVHNMPWKQLSSR